MARDRDLVEAAQRGDQAAFVDLVGSTGDRLFALAYRILRDVDRTEDALQDALVIAWRDLRGLRDPDRFDGWINRVVTNVCISHATRERRRTANLRMLPVDGPAAPDDLLGVGERDQLERGTHSVRLACAAKNGDTWAVAGRVEHSTVPGEVAGPWSVVTVKDGPPQQITIWLSGDFAGSDCAGFLAAFDFAALGAENFSPVESGRLVPPPDPAP